MLQTKPYTIYEISYQHGSKIIIFNYTGSMPMSNSLQNICVMSRLMGYISHKGRKTKRLAIENELDKHGEAKVCGKMLSNIVWQKVGKMTQKQFIAHIKQRCQKETIPKTASQ